MIDWPKIKNKYINSTLSARELADMYGVSLSSVSKKVTNEKWQELRAAQCKNIESRLIEKTTEKIIDEEAEISAAKARIRKAIYLQLEKRISDVEIDNADFRRLVQNYRDMVELEPEDFSDVEDSDFIFEAAGI